MNHCPLSFTAEYFSNACYKALTWLTWLNWHSTKQNTGPVQDPLFFDIQSTVQYRECIKTCTTLSLSLPSIAGFPYCILPSGSRVIVQYTSLYSFKEMYATGSNRVGDPTIKKASLYADKMLKTGKHKEGNQNVQLSLIVWCWHDRTHFDISLFSDALLLRIPISKLVCRTRTVAKPIFKMMMISGSR